MQQVIEPLLRSDRFLILPIDFLFLFFSSSFKKFFFLFFYGRRGSKPSKKKEEELSIVFFSASSYSLQNEQLRFFSFTLLALPI